MNLNLLDPKLIVLAAVVILIIAVLAWLYVRKRRSTTAASWSWTPAGNHSIESSNSPPSARQSGLQRNSAALLP